MEEYGRIGAVKRDLYLHPVEERDIRGPKLPDHKLPLQNIEEGAKNVRICPHIQFDKFILLTQLKLAVCTKSWKTKERWTNSNANCRKLLFRSGEIQVMILNMTSKVKMGKLKQNTNY